MNKPLIVANWKANKTIKEASEWVRTARTNLEEATEVEVVVCPSHVCLPLVFSLLGGTSVKLGAQNLSIYEKGAYTGEDTAEMLEGLVTYVIIGHSERRRFFGEMDQTVAEKTAKALKYKITPLVCVESLEQVEKFKIFAKDSLDKAIFVYEPTFAIGTGQPDTPENAAEMARKIRQVVDRETKVLYGGSVARDNVVDFLFQADLGGVLVGTASLDPQEFCGLVSSTNYRPMVK
ncbi:MAG: triose-phosphate isomerase [Patescibacteria group bacterium]|nr:triose-phosphate isomerase [Patescibacteria group bacterium]